MKSTLSAILPLLFLLIILSATSSISAKNVRGSASRHELGVFGELDTYMLYFYSYKHSESTLYCQPSMKVEEGYAIQFHSSSEVNLASAIVTTAIALHVLTFLLWLYVSAWHYVGDIANACERLVTSWRERRRSLGGVVVVLARRSVLGL